MKPELPILLAYKSMEELSQRIKNQQEFKELKIDANLVFQNQVPQNIVKNQD